MSQPEMKHAFFVYSVLICEHDDALHQGYFFEGDSLWFGVNPASSVLYSACPAASNKKSKLKVTETVGSNRLELRARAQRHRAPVRTSLIPNRNHADADRDVNVIEFKSSEVRTRQPICSSIPHANGLAPSMAQINSIKPLFAATNSTCRPTLTSLTYKFILQRFRFVKQ